MTEDIFGVLRRWSLIGGGRLHEVVARGHSTGRMNYFIYYIFDLRQLNASSVTEYATWSAMPFVQVFDGLN